MSSDKKRSETKRKGMTVAEAGRKGGLSTKKKYGKEHLKKQLAKGREKLKTLIEIGKQIEREMEKEMGKESAKSERNKGDNYHSGDESP